MLYSNSSYIKQHRKYYDVNDITAVYGIRLTEFNPWVLERVELLANYFFPQPNFLIVDFGSTEEYAQQLRDACQRNNLVYFRVDDEEIFSAAIARNRGFEQVKTELVFFNDIDCFAEANLFARLADAANSFELALYYDKYLNLPVYHFTEEVSNEFFNPDSTSDRSGYISRSFTQSVYSKRWRVSDFVAPYSNVFLCRTDFFSLTGGYNEAFRGHGSEDFEYLIRQGIYANRFPLPEKFGEDHYSVIRDSYYSFFKEYNGFRRFFEVVSLETELAGLRVGHLWHPKPSEHNWVSNNDWKRQKFNEITAKYLTNGFGLLNMDWIKRERKCLALVKHQDHMNFIYPLRLAGYHITYAGVGSDQSRYEVIKSIDSGEFDSVVIFNPYMKSHSDLYMVFEYAKRKGLTPIVVERGALPQSWYYAEDMSYVDRDFINLDLDHVAVENPEVVEEFLANLHSGTTTLEQNDNYEITIGKYKIASVLAGKTCFIPLQLSDDVAITRFNDEKQPYLDFNDEIFQVAVENPDVLFFIKPHPLSKEVVSSELKNVVACTEKDNIHALIDLCDGLICYNSGVGLISVLHEKKTITVGNAYYVNKDLAHSAPNFATAVQMLFDPAYFKPTHESVCRLVSWLINEKYSFYHSESVIRDFGTRKSHGYQNSRCYHLNYNGLHLSGNVDRISNQFDLISYGAGKLMIKAGIERRAPALTPKVSASRPVEKSEFKAASAKKEVGKPKPSAKPVAVSPTITVDRSKTSSGFSRKLSKLLRNPRLFFADMGKNRGA